MTPLNLRFCDYKIWLLICKLRKCGDAVSSAYVFVCVLLRKKGLSSIRQSFFVLEEFLRVFHSQRKNFDFIFGCGLVGFFRLMRLFSFKDAFGCDLVVPRNRRLQP